MEKRSLIIRFVLILSFFTAAYSNAQVRLDNWQAHTSLYEIRDACLDLNGSIWAATSGGIFKYSPDKEDFEYYQNINALLNPDITAIECDVESGYIFAGAANGTVEIFIDGEWAHVRDISNSDFTNPEITDFVINGNSAYISGGFGIAVLDIEELVFKESILRFGDLPAGIGINRILIEGNDIYAATEGGLAISSLDKVLSDPKSWEIYGLSHGLDNNMLLDMEYLDGKVFVSTESGIFSYSDTGFVDLGIQEESIMNITAYNDELLYATQFDIKDTTGKAFELPHPAHITGLKAVNNHDRSYLLPFYNLQSYGITEGDDIRHIRPQSPVSNLFTDIDFQGGLLWCATDRDPRGQGFQLYDGRTWYHRDKSIHPMIKGNNLHRISARPDSKAWLSTWGNGLLELFFEQDTFRIERYDRYNSPMIGIGDDNAFVVTGRTAFDFNGTAWNVTFGLSDPGPVIVAFPKEGDPVGFTNCVDPNYRFYMELTIDFFGTKWLGSFTDADRGLLYYNENNTLYDDSDDICGRINTSDNSGLANMVQNCLTTDQDGMVWIGTPTGISVIINPSAVLSGQNPIIRKDDLVGSQVINDILVDALNNKWVATNTGVWVLNPDATEVIGIVDKSNSPLPTNTIEDLATDPETGIIYFGTSQGLYQATSFAVEPRQEYSIKCYPQPFDPGRHDELVIEGLAPESDIRIITPGGIKVRTIQTRGRKTTWDGLDDDGNTVPNGVYLVVGTSLENDASGVQKIAVVRK
ncbi:MAG: hypothetical protein ACLFQU_13070 [Candidatus Kapaibacterium sp.]